MKNNNTFKCDDCSGNTYTVVNENIFWFEISVHNVVCMTVNKSAIESCGEEEDCIRVDLHGNLLNNLFVKSVNILLFAHNLEKSTSRSIFHNSSN